MKRWMRLLCYLSWHEWHWYRQTGGGKQKRCVRCDTPAHNEPDR